MSTTPLWSSRQAMYIAWIAALRSGKYSQARGQLRRTFSDIGGAISHGYCCLGVLCDINVADRNGQWLLSDYYQSGGEHTTQVSGALTIELMRHLGITESEQRHLFQLNDKVHSSFLEIAGYIENEIMPLALSRPQPYIENPHKYQVCYNS